MPNQPGTTIIGSAAGRTPAAGRRALGRSAFDGGGATLDFSFVAVFSESPGDSTWLENTPGHSK
jgi:hypothetical protein